MIKISEVVTVLGRPRRGASQVEKSPRLKWATKFFTLAYDGARSPNVSLRIVWISFGTLPCRKKRTWWQLTSRSRWNRLRCPTCFLSASVTRKDLQFGTPLFPTALSIPSYDIGKWVGLRTYQHPLVVEISKKIEHSGSWRWVQYFASKRRDPVALWHKLIVQKGEIIG